MKAKGKKTTLASADYRQWIGELKTRYRATQIKAAVAVNSALIEFYWNLGKDIRNRFAGSAGYGSNFFRRLNVDLTEEFPNVRGFSERNLKYCLDFYDLYCESEILQQSVAKSKRRMSEVNLQRVVADLICVPWGHHCILIDKCKGDRKKALFYIRRTIQNGWSRNTLLNWLSTDLYEREGKGQTNFALTMPSDECDLAQQLAKDPQVFEVFGLLTSSRRFSRPKPSWRSAMPTPKRKSLRLCRQWQPSRRSKDRRKGVVLLQRRTE